MLGSDLKILEYFCVHQSIIVFKPIHVYMRYELAGSGTTYLIFHSRKSKNIRLIKKKLVELWEIPAKNESMELDYPDVFKLHCMIFHELIQSQRDFLLDCQDRVNYVLDEIDKHIGDVSRREKLKEFTIELNEIAQDLDVHTYSLDQTLKNMQTLSKPHHLLETASCSSSRGSSSFSLTESIERLRMLQDLDESNLSYLKSRRETAMNLVSPTFAQRDTRLLCY